MSDFNKAFDRVIGHEGGYVNHPSDPGGETNWGVTRNTARAYGYNGDMRAMTREQAKPIYKTGFWDRIQGGISCMMQWHFNFLMPLLITASVMLCV